MDVREIHTVVVGSGAAGLNAADRLFQYGVRDLALVTENLNWGTSRNTGSDKQTYYKLWQGMHLTVCGSWRRCCMMVAAWTVNMPCVKRRCPVRDFLSW